MGEFINNLIHQNTLKEQQKPTQTNKTKTQNHNAL